MKLEITLITERIFKTKDGRSFKEIWVKISAPGLKAEWVRKLLMEI